ncbi:type I restriction endonuclease subunit S [Salmonella enterica]|nr:type I restriction endonuclease subunit S [Salmonella enterica]
MSGGKLPEGWVVTSISSAISNQGLISDGDWVESKDQDPKGSVRLIQLADIGDGYFKDKSNRYMTPQKAQMLSCTYLSPGDVLVARMPDPLGRACIFPGVNQKAVTVVDVCLLRTSSDSAISNTILKYWINSPALRATIALNASGSTRKRITKKKLEQLEIPVASLAEQKIIAEKLDTLLAQVDSTKARLEQIPKILKRFRQAVLATAMSGKLTNLPTANYLKIKDIACVIGGLTKNSKRNNFELKVPYLRVANVYENELKLDDVAEIGVQPNELRRVSLEYEDLLIVEGNGSLDQIGRAALWRKEIQECVHQNHLIKVRANKAVLYPTFLLFYLMSPQGKEEIVNRATSGAGLYTLSISKISSINVPVYSLPEQHEIVRRVEQLFAYADTIEKQVNSALTRVNSLTQSILAKAFRGDLTAQWRAENPSLISGENSAAALLEKIKAERAASGGKKASRKKA